jgi:hypothetical protein
MEFWSIDDYAMVFPDVINPIRLVWTRSADDPQHAREWVCRLRGRVPITTTLMRSGGGGRFLWSGRRMGDPAAMRAA